MLLRRMFFLGSISTPTGTPSRIRAMGPRQCDAVGAEEETMRWIPGIPAALILFISAPAFPQDRVENPVEDWARFVSPDDGFSANYPGRPKVDAFTYMTEYRQSLPARVYNAADALGRYSTTVVDYRGIEKVHTERAAKCQAAKGANLQDGDACQNDFRVDVAGATDHAVWNFMKRDGVKMTHYMYY